MKKVITLVLSIVFLASASFVGAQVDSGRGSSAQTYTHASEDSIFHQFSDWIATVGKSKAEKRTILAKRKADRVRKRAEKKARTYKRKVEEGSEKGSKKGSY